jgi:hypothetical protein
VTSTLATGAGVNAISHTWRESMSRKLRAPAALAIVVLVGAGCSNGSAYKDHTGTASSGGNSSIRRAAYRSARRRAATAPRSRGGSSPQVGLRTADQGDDLNVATTSTTTSRPADAEKR